MITFYTDCMGMIATEELQKIDQQKCAECDAQFDTDKWQVECAEEHCCMTAHVCCMLPNLWNVSQLLCRDHWKKKFGSVAQPSLTDRLICVLTFCSMEEEEFFFVTVNKTGNYVTGYWKNQESPLTKTEAAAVRQYRCQAWGVYFGYRISPWSRKTILLSDDREVVMYRYRIGAKPAPLCMVQEDFLQHKTKTYLQSRGNYFWNNRTTVKKQHPNSIQGGNHLRFKTHINGSYHTTKNQEVEDCSLKFGIAFRGVEKQKLIKDLCTDLSFVAEAAGVPAEEYSFLVGDMSPASGIVFMFATYNGGGIYSHIDQSFKGPVFVLVVGMKERAPDKSKGKVISFAQNGQSTNAYAELVNKEHSMYFFYGYFTDFACHGVPKMAGYTCTVFIVRCRR